MSRWLLYGAPSAKDELESVGRAWDSSAQCVFLDDAEAIITFMKSLNEQQPHILVSDGEVKAINMGAALKFLNSNAEIVLYAPEASDDLKRNAQKAGISWVLDRQALSSQAFDEQKPPARGDASVVALKAAPFSQKQGVSSTQELPGANVARGSLEAQSVQAAALQEGEAFHVVEGEPNKINELLDTYGFDLFEPELVETEQVGVHFAEAKEAASNNSIAAKDFKACGALVMLASGRGGVGKSAIASMMAVAAATWNLDVALLDLDLLFGDVYTFFSLTHPGDLASVDTLPVPNALNQAAQKVKEGLTVYGPCLKPELAELVIPHLQEILTELDRRHDLVIIDGSTQWGEMMALAAQMSDRVLLVADERAGALSSFVRCSQLVANLGVPRAKTCRLMNRCDAKRRDAAFMAAAQEGLAGASLLEVIDGGFDVEDLLEAGKAIDLFNLGEFFGRSCASALAKVLHDIGKLPQLPEAQKARDAQLFGKPGLLFRLVKEAA